MSRKMCVHGYTHQHLLGETCNHTNYMSVLISFINSVNVTYLLIQAFIPSDFLPGES